MANINNEIKNINSLLSKENLKDFLDYRYGQINISFNEQVIEIIYGTLDAPNFKDKIKVIFKGVSFIKGNLLGFNETFLSQKENSSFIKLATKEEELDILGEYCSEENKKLNTHKEYLFKIMVSDENAENYIVAENISYEIVK